MPTTVDVSGLWKRPDGTAARGEVTFTPSVGVVDGTDDVLLAPAPLRVTLTGGSFTATLWATDDPDWNTTWAYQVSAVIDGTRYDLGDVTVPESASAGGANLADLATGSSSGGGAPSGFVPSSPDGTMWAVGVTTGGALQTTAVGSVGDATTSLVLTAPDGGLWSLDVTNGGALTTSSVGTAGSSTTSLSLTDADDVNWTVGVTNAGALTTTAGA